MSTGPGDRATPLLLPQAAQFNLDGHADQAAVTDASRTWTWGELNRRAAGVADGLTRAGLEPRS